MRQCGDCTLCCRLVAVESLGKGHNQRCQHQRFRKGCAIYTKRPLECRTWDCAWVINEPDTADMLRPDRAHYVIDRTPTGVVDVEGADGQSVPMLAMAIYVDPKHPNAYRDPKLLAMLERRAERGILGLINREFLMIPPSMSGTGEWAEMPVDLAAQRRRETAQSI